MAEILPETYRMLTKANERLRAECARLLARGDKAELELNSLKGNLIRKSQRGTPMKLWGLMRGKRGLAPVGLPTRADVQDWAGQRHMPAESYRNRQGNPSAIWHEVKRLHPDFRLVRVTLNGSGDSNG